MTNPHHGGDTPASPAEQHTAGPDREPTHPIRTSAGEDATAAAPQPTLRQPAAPHPDQPGAEPPTGSSPAEPVGYQAGDAASEPADLPPGPHGGGPSDPGPAAAPGWGAHAYQPGFGPPATPPPFSSRLGLVRPIEGRKLVGVCAAIGHATNTDPVLWRVLFAVLSFFGGLGILAYLIGWLVIPGEGDTTSPVESLVGRGRSATSPAVVILALVAAVLAVRFVFSDGFNAALVGVAVLVGAALLLVRRNRPPMPGAPGLAPLRPPDAYAGYPAPYGTYPPGPMSDQTVSMPMPMPPQAPAMPPPVEYGAPLAPHGPFAGPGPYGASLGYPAAGAPTGPPPSAPPPTGKRARPPKPPREKSRLTRLTLSAVLLLLGVVAVLHLTGVKVPPSAYVAVALGTVGAGLVVGAWRGRGRWLIPIGIVLTIALTITTAEEQFERRRVDNVNWVPTDIATLENSVYRNEYGDATLNLSGLDFTDRSVSVEARVEVGNLVVILPPNVDVTLRARTEVGDVRALGQSWGGIDTGMRTITDEGADGPGGGALALDARVTVGQLEVRR